MKSRIEHWAYAAALATLLPACGASHGSEATGADASEDSASTQAPDSGEGNVESGTGAGPDGAVAPEAGSDGGQAVGSDAGDAAGSNPHDAAGSDATTVTTATDASASNDAAGETSEAGADAGPCSGDQLYCGGFCVPNDTVNCGTCGNDCTNLHASSTPECVAGACSFPSLTCTAGWAHCSADASAGCETDLSQAATCGSCTTACTSPSVCAGTAGSYACSGGPVAIACASQATFALLSNGTIEAWGSNDGAIQSEGSLLGDGDSNADETATAVQVTGITTATAVAGGDGHACAILADTTVMCWGDNEFGQLGIDPNTSIGALTPVAVAGLTGVTAIAAGIVHTCALLSNGTVKCWGDNNEGELGTTSTASCNDEDACSYTPVTVPGLSDVIAIAIGGDEHFVNDNGERGDHTCALLSSGSIKCWGQNSDGELGGGTKTTSSPYGTPTLTTVSGITDAVAINANDLNSCALISGGTVKCWGWGALGDGSFTDTDTPVSVSGLSDAASLSVGSTSATVCAVLTNGAAVCWGNGYNGQLGDGAPDGATMGTVTSTPVAVLGLTNIATMATGQFFTAALLQSGEVYAWGSDGDDEIANASADLNYNYAPLQEQW